MTTAKLNPLRAALAMVEVMRNPKVALPTYLAQPHSFGELLRHTVLPWAMVRPLAILLRSLMTDAMRPGIVMATGSFVLQVGTWLALSLALPAVARPFGLHLPERQALVLTALICAPLWLSGLLFAIPEDPPVLWALTRLIVLVVAAYGLVLLRQALRLLIVPEPAHLPLVAGAAAAYLLIYLVVFTVVGIGANVVLYFWSRGA